MVVDVYCSLGDRITILHRFFRSGHSWKGCAVESGPWLRDLLLTLLIWTVILALLSDSVELCSVTQLESG